MKQAVRILFFVLATLSVGHAQELFPLQAVPVPTGAPQWIVSQLYDCVTPYSIGNSFGRSDTSSGICIIPWGVSDTGQPSYTGESLILLMKWNIASAQTITSVRLQNNAATCSPIPGASAINNTAGTNLVAYLCPNLVRPANVAMVQWSGPVGSDVEIGVAEVYGCTAPCVAEGGNASSLAYGPASTPVSISTSAPTTANNDLIMSFTTPNAQIGTSAGACCTASFVGGNNFTHGEYQIGATQQIYTNTFNAGGGPGFVNQVIFALQQNPAPPVANVGSIIQQGYSAPDTATAGTVVGNVSAMTTDRSRFLGTLAMPTNPGGLLNFDPGSGILTLARTLTPADDNISPGYAGQLSATENNTPFIQPIAFHVLPPLTTDANSNCHSQSTPPPAALRAGLTKRAYCLDGAGAKYAAAQNWIDCNQTDQPGFEWYIGGFPTLVCNDVTQGTDPVTGRSSVILHYHSTTDWNTMQALHPGDPGILGLGMGSQNSCFNGPCVPFFYTVPATSYVEWGIRSAPIMNDGVGHTPAPAWWEYGTCPDLTNANCNYPNAWSIQEFDDMEAYGPCPNCGATTLHDWFDIGSGVQDKTGGSGSTQSIVSNYHNSVPGWNITDYHRYGALRTVDGTSTKRNAMYLDDVLVKNGAPLANGTSNPFDQPVLSTETTNGLDETSMLSTRQFLVIWFGGTFGLNTTACQSQPACVAAGGDPDQFTYIDHLEVWQAPDDPINGVVSGQVTVANGLTQ